MPANRPGQLASAPAWWRRRWLLLVSLLALLSGGAGLTIPSALAHASASASASSPRIYWDQNEEEDWLIHPGVEQPTPLVPPWDPNGQAALFPDGSGHFTTGYNPTYDPTNPGYKKPLMMPPVGEVVWDEHGGFTGKTLAVPGPYLGGDIPGNTKNPYDGSFNSNGTYVGSAFDPSTGNFFTTDLGNAQGTIPPQDSGRLIEWFKNSNYTNYCILYGPTSGGSEPHHVDGTGGLRQPGTIALDSAGNVLLPVLGVGHQLQGEVLQFLASSMPRSAAQCPAANENMPRGPVQYQALINTTADDQPSPQGIARDPSCGCWAVSSVLVGTAVAWYNDDGTPDLSRPPVPGNPPPPVSAGNTTSGYSPYGLAFTRDGTLYFADMHNVCVSPPTESSPFSGVGCGPAANEGQVMRVTFSQQGEFPSTPVPVNTKPLNFPVSTTACDPATYAHCPAPPGA